MGDSSEEMEAGVVPAVRISFYLAVQCMISVWSPAGPSVLAGQAAGQAELWGVLKEELL